MVKDSYDQDFSSELGNQIEPTPSRPEEFQTKLHKTFNAFFLILVITLSFIVYKQFNFSKDLENQLEDKTKIEEDLKRQISSALQELPKLSTENNSLKKANTELQEISQSMALQLANKAGMKVIFKE